MSMYADFLKDNNDIIDKINSAIMARDFHSIKDVYIDLSLIKDTRLGLMLALSNDNDREYILAGIENYNIRPNRSFTFTYPKFRYNESELSKMYKDENRSDDIFIHSPDTEYSYVLPSILNELYRKNTTVKHMAPINVTVNTWPLKITSNMELFKDMFNQCTQGAAKMSLVCWDQKHISNWNKYSIISIDDLEYVMGKDIPFSTELFDDKKLANTQIFAPYACSPEILHKWQQFQINFNDSKIVSDLFGVTETVFNYFSKFTFIPFTIPFSPKD